MSFFEWDKSLDVSVEEMNEQHRTLIGFINAVFEKNFAGAPKAEIVKSIQELFSFVAKHFQDEEHYMASIKFPGLEAHKKLHGNLATDMTKLAEDFKNGPAEKISGEFSMFLKLWLSTHIRGIDTKYGDYARSLQK
jgi:hemerythrin-like metal-binding protein